MDMNQRINQFIGENESLRVVNAGLASGRDRVVAAANELGYQFSTEVSPLDYLIETARASVMVNQKNVELTGQRDNAWQELREIREAINANPEESTADEVRRIMSQLVAVQDSVVHGKCANSEPCATFCEAIATRKMFKQLQVERDALAAKVESLKSKSINQQASAWSAVYDFVRKYVPDFSMMKGSGKEQVLSAIDGLIKRNRELSNLINPHHLAARDAEVAAKAVEDFCKSADGLAIEKCPKESDGCSDDLITGWKAGNVDCRMAGFKYAAQLRAKAGKQ